MRGVELTVRLRNVIRLAKAVRRLAEQAAWLDGAAEAALRHMREREEEIIFRLALAVEYRDNDTGDHTWRVARYSQIVAEGLGLAPEICRNLYLAAPLHDVGKVGIPDGILLKPGRLDPEEFDRHQDARDHRPAHPGRQRLRADLPRRGDRRVRITRDGTAAATRTGSPAPRSPCRPGSSRWRTCSTP